MSHPDVWAYGVETSKAITKRTRTPKRRHLQALSQSSSNASNSKRRARFEPGADDLPAGGEPHPVMRGDVGERLVEPGDAVRHADQVGMQADRHDPAGLRALGVKRVELAFD